MVTREENLLGILSRNDVTFFIPPYQRNYEWDAEQCDVFFRDIRKTYELNLKNKNRNANNSAKHFIGSITYFPTEGNSTFDPKELVLIDGQQRITTTMIFLAALRDSIEDEETKNIINNKYLYNATTKEGSEHKVKLKQVETDYEAYKKTIQREDLSKTEKNSAVYSNYKRFVDMLKNEISKGTDLYELIDLGLAHFIIVSIELDPSKQGENPQEIFESMNSIGKPLSLADLVRNYVLLGLSPKKQDEYYKRYWLNIEQRLPGSVSNFIRDYMQTYSQKSYAKASEKNYKPLYAEFKSLFSETLDNKGNIIPYDVTALLEDLNKYSKIYQLIISDYSSGNSRIDGILRDLRILKVTTSYSFLMTLLSYWKDDKFTDNETISILEAFFTYCLRRRITGETNAENKNMPTLSRKIELLVNSADKKTKMFDILSNMEKSCRLPNDIEITQRLKEMNFFNFDYSKFILALIEEELTRSRPDISEENLQKEHILPQTINGTMWEEELGPNAEELHSIYVNRIGNLTLIRQNQELGNKPFIDKKYTYINNSGMQIAKTMITDRSMWGVQEIEARGDWLINELLTKIIPIPENRRKTNNFAEKKRSSRAFSFSKIGIIGKVISFISDPTITARVVNDKEIELEGKRYKLSPATAYIMGKKGTKVWKAYQGSNHWQYEGIKLLDLMNEKIEKEQEEENDNE